MENPDTYVSSLVVLSVSFTIYSVIVKLGTRPHLIWDDKPKRAFHVRNNTETPVN